MNKEQMEKLELSLRALGIKDKQVTTEVNDSFTVRVYLNGKCAGLWDIVKNTFVE